MNDRDAATRDWFGARLAGIAAIVVTTSMLLAVGAVAAPGGEKGKPQSEPPPAEPQPQAAEPQAPPPKAKPTKPAKPAPPPPPPSSKPAKPQRQSQAAQPQAAAPRTKANARGPKPKAPRPTPHATAKSNPTGHGPAGKTTFCHSTRSGTNPFVTVTSSNNSLPQAHVQHHDGADVIPAPSGGCPGSAGGPVNGGQGSDGHGPGGKETFCHSTRSATNPFVVITTSVNALLAHDRHHGGDDVIPATNGDCPGRTTTSVTLRPGGPDDGGPQDESGINGIDGVDGPGNGGGPDDAGGPGTRDVADSDVLGATETSPGTADGGPVDSRPVAEDDAAPVETGGAPVVAEEKADDGPLPFTGRSLLATLVAALLALAVGLIARRVVGRVDA